MRDFERLSREADAIGLRLEIVRGIPVFEALPVARHQAAIFRIQSSIRAKVLEDTPCHCAHYSDVQIHFSDGSRKRPDIAIFCEEPEQTTEITAVPKVVVEVISADYEEKDLLISVPFYQQVQIPDIIVFDPETNVVRHWRNVTDKASYLFPVTIELLCGCTITF